MITLDKEWECVAQIVGRLDVGYPAYYSQNLVEIKNALVMSGWTVTHSSSSVAAGAGDLWTDYSKVVWGSGAHSWIVLTCDLFRANFAICIDCIGTGNSYITFEAAPSGYNADGTTSARPTSAGTVLTWTSDFVSPNPNGVLSNVIKVLRSTDRKNYRVILTNGGAIGDSPSFTTYRGQAWLFEQPKSPASWWPSPFVVGRFSHQYHGLSYARLTTSGLGTMATVIDGTRVNVVLGTIGVADWPTRSGVYAFGGAYGGRMAMPPLYFLGDNAAYPGVLGIMYDAYPINPYHLTGTRYPTTTNSRGLMKAGAIAIGCPYGPMVV